MSLYAYIGRASQPTRHMPRTQREQRLERAPMRKAIYDAAQKLHQPKVAWSAHRLWEDLFVVAFDRASAGRAAIVPKEDARRLVRMQGGKLPQGPFAARRALQRRQAVLVEAGACRDWGTHLEPLLHPEKGSDLWIESPNLEGGATNLSPPRIANLVDRIGREEQICSPASYGNPKSVAAKAKTRERSGMFRRRADAPLLSPPSAPTSLQEEKILTKGPSPALPATKAPEELPAGSSCRIPPKHPVRAIPRELARAARRTASCELPGSGHVESAMPQSFADAVEQMRHAAPLAAPLAASPTLATQERRWTPTPGASSTGESSCLPPSTPCSAPTGTAIWTDSSWSANIAPKTQSDARVSISAQPATRERTTPFASAAITGPDNELAADETLLSPASLATMAELPAFLRVAYRRTLRQMALTRLREGKPPWESAEESAARDEAPRRLSEAEAHGFRKANAKKRPGPIFASPQRLRVSAPADDHLPADVMWLRAALGGVCDLSRIWFRPEVRGRYSRAHWRAAVAKLIAQPRSSVAAIGPYLFCSLQAFASGHGHDNRQATLYTVRRGWDVRLARFAQVEERMPNWIAAYGGHDQLA